MPTFAAPTKFHFAVPPPKPSSTSVQQKRQPRAKSPRKHDVSTQPLQETAAFRRPSDARRRRQSIPQSVLQVGDAFADVEVKAGGRRETWKPMTNVKLRKAPLKEASSQSGKLINRSGTDSGRRASAARRSSEEDHNDEDDDDDMLEAQEPDELHVAAHGTTVEEFGSHSRSQSDEHAQQDADDDSDESMLDPGEVPSHGDHYNEIHEPILGPQQYTLQPRPPTPAQTPAKRPRLNHGGRPRLDEVSPAAQRPSTPPTASVHEQDQTPWSPTLSYRHGPSSWTIRTADKTLSEPRFKARPTFGTPVPASTSDTSSFTPAPLPTFTDPQELLRPASIPRPRFVHPVPTSTVSASAAGTETGAVRPPPFLGDVATAFSPHHRKKTRFTHDGWANQARSWILDAGGRCDLPRLSSVRIGETQAGMRSPHSHSKPQARRGIRAAPEIAVRIASIHSHVRDDEANTIAHRSASADGATRATVAVGSIEGATSMSRLLFVDGESQDRSGHVLREGNVVRLASPAWELHLPALEERTQAVDLSRSRETAEARSERWLVCARWRL